MLVSPTVDGHVFAHYSMIRDEARWRGVQVGQPVSFTWDPSPQDGCPNRAIDVYTTPERRTVAQRDQSDPDAYTSSLVIHFDDSDEPGPLTAPPGECPPRWP